MAAAKFLILLLLICCAVVFAQRDSGSNSKPELGPQDAPQKHFEKRSLEHEDGDLGDAFVQPAYENAFERPHRIRVLPGYLH